MSFGSNVKPPRFGAGKTKSPGVAQWVCGCGTSLSKFIQFCSRCGKGQPK